MDVEYEGDKTINLYSLEMAKKYIIPELLKIKNLIWISCNNIVDGWNGNYFRERPKNIKLIEKYSKLFCKYLPNVINLHVWSNDEVKKYTCDNMHLTNEGSDFIYTKLTNRIEKNILIIMGNGPSLKNVDFGLLKKYDTFGINSAYRKYEELYFYPTYFGCFDYKVCEYHKKNFSKLINNSIIEKFFFLEKNFFSVTDQNNLKFQTINFKHNYSDIISTFDNFINMGCSGANCTQVGILLGYKKIILIGCDANYINFIKESQNINGILKIVKTPDNNPNYWFDNYQIKDDIYNIPNPNIWHLPAWDRINKLSKKTNVDVVNCSSISKIECFRKSKIINEC